MRQYSASCLIICCLLVTACVTTLGKSDEKVDDLWSQWGEENKRQHLSFGERIYVNAYDQVFTSAITAMADIGFSVKNMERQSGYLLAEGPNPLPIEEQKALSQKMVDEINRVSRTQWFVQLGNANHAATLTIIKLPDGRTKVKLRFVTVAIQGNYSTRYHSIYPPLLEADYRYIWGALEKQLFLDIHLDK